MIIIVKSDYMGPMIDYFIKHGKKCICITLTLENVLKFSDTE